MHAAELATLDSTTLLVAGEIDDQKFQMLDRRQEAFDCLLDDVPELDGKSSRSPFRANEAMWPDAEAHDAWFDTLHEVWARAPRELFR